MSEKCLEGCLKGVWKVSKRHLQGSCFGIFLDTWYLKDTFCQYLVSKWYLFKKKVSILLNLMERTIDYSQIPQCENKFIVQF